MSATSATPAVAQVEIPRPALIPRVLSAFSGTPGVVAKIVLLGILNAFAFWAMYVLLTRSHWVSVVVLALATAGIDLVYLAPTRKTLPLKFLIPGTIFLVGFQVIPIFYTVKVALSNYSTGHVITKHDAIQQIKINSLQPPPNGRSYTMTVARTSSGELVLLLQDQTSKKFYVGTTKALTPLAPSTVTSGPLGITAAKGYTVVKGAELFALDKTLQNFIVPVGKAGIRPQTISTAVELEPTLRYDAKRGVFIRLSDGAVFADNGKGAFAHGADELEPGWTTGVGAANFKRIAKDPLVRQPFLRVLIWTITFAALSVAISFAAGLFLAITLDKRGMRFQRVYRTILVIPWAIPGFLALLVWAGLFNDKFGVINRMFHIGIPWLFDANWAKVTCILVNAWMSTPYFFLVSMGALQAIPDELTEAGRVDGGTPFQLFRRVTFPLLLVAVAPLLIASFAFNFNNFNAIYFLTAGGPPQANSSIAGSTDILISYTYKLAFAAGKGQDLALASAFSIIIFAIVALISAIAFSRTRALEELA
ncbi:MAG TPA: ABC transporter permease subunit [Gaiellaceae bacterium]|nr:ABC transporter permease subunit [Gaiellaceae bacterium]